MEEHRQVEKDLSGKAPLEILKRYEKWKDIATLSGPSGRRMKLARTAFLLPAAIAAFAGAAALVGVDAAATGAEQQASSPLPPPSPEAIQRAVAPASSLPQGQVQPAAVEALARMSRFLQSLPAAGLVAKGSLDVVNVQGQRIQIDGTTTIDMKRRGFVIHHVNDLRSRDFYFDGKQFTMVSPKLNFYATIPASGTNHDVVETVYNKYGLRLPLEDFFQWAAPGTARTDQLVSAFSMGSSMQDGVNTTHYVFRDSQLDWELWIQDGPQPLPRKLSIVDRTNPARPAFTARLSWNLNPTISDSDFTFKPGLDVKRIEMSVYKG